MKHNLKPCSLNFDNSDISLNESLNRIEMLNVLLEGLINNNLSDETFLKLYNKNYEFRDKSISRNYAKFKFKTAKILTIKTNIIKKIDCENKNSYCFVSFVIACKENLNFEDKMYSFEEIQNLVKDGKVVVLNYINGKEIETSRVFNKNFVTDKYLKLEDLDNSIFLSQNYGKKFSKYYPDLIGYIKKSLTVEQVQDDIIKFKKDLKETIEICKKQHNKRIEFLKNELLKSQQVINDLSEVDKRIIVENQQEKTK